MINQSDITNNVDEAMSPILVTNKSQTSKLEQLCSLLPFKFAQQPVIAALQLHGVIGKVGSFKTGLCLTSLNDAITKAFNLPKLQAVCLNINSPGGSPVQSELIAKRIRELAKLKQIPVYSFVEDVAASGGYWLACAGDKIYASKSSIIGSIGVVSRSFGFHEALDKLGVERRIYTEGKNKSILDPFLPVKTGDIKIIKHIQEQIHKHFIDYVKERRAGKLTQNDDILFNGEFWAGESAVDFGLIDGIHDMYSFIRDKFGEDTKIEHITNKQSWLKKKLGIGSSSIVQQFTDHLLQELEGKLLYNKFDLF